MEKRLIAAKEVTEDLDCSIQHAYKIVRKLNAELEDMGCLQTRSRRPAGSARSRVRK